jgi:hypothetical protein
MNRKKRSLAALILGFIGLCSLLGAARLQVFHPADIVGLVASGMCIGVAIGMVLGQRKPTAE